MIIKLLSKQFSCYNIKKGFYSLGISDTLVPFTFVVYFLPELFILNYGGVSGESLYEIKLSM